jgi:hypothetical protein
MRSFFRLLTLAGSLPALALSFRAQAQLCGGGSAAFTVYVPNEDRVDNLRYELFDLSPNARTSLKDYYSKHSALLDNRCSESFVVDPELVQSLLRNHSLTPALTGSYTGIAHAAGPIQNGTIAFPTSVGGVVRLLRITSPGREINIVTLFECDCDFGKGCTLLWGSHPSLVYRHKD